MTLLPEDIDFRASSAAAAARVRGSKPLTDSSVGSDTSVAIKCIGAYQGLETEDELASLEDERVAAPLIAAARTLTSVAENLRTTGGESAQSIDGLLLYAAVAYGMQGNFASSRAVLSTVSGEYIVETAARRIAATVCDPSHPPAAPTNEDLSENEQIFHESWARALQLPNIALLRKCIDLFGAVALSGDFSDRGLLLSVEVAARQAFRLSTAHLRDSAPEIPTWFVTGLLRSKRSTLLPPQRQLLIDLHFAGSKNNSLLNLPTSTGKTLVAEACIASSIAEGGTAIFVAPYVAIGEQVLRSLQTTLGNRANIVPMFGGFNSDSPSIEGDEAQVIVATPERLDGLLRSGRMTSAIRLVIFDEFHMVENGPRGTRLEGLVARLRLLQKQGKALRLIALSAVLPEAEQLCKWLSVPKSDYHRIGWRPTARRLAVCRADGLLFWIHGTDSLRPIDKNAGSRLGSSVRVALPNDTRAAKNYPSHALSFASAENVGALAWDLSVRIPGPGLIVCPRKSDTRSVARAIAALSWEFDPPQALLAVAASIESRYAWLTPLAECLRVGVAFHNASLPFDVRRDIEAEIRALHLRFVASTTTLAEGADLPFRWTLLSHWLTGVHEGARPVKALTFRNIAGRSGRANAYPEGDTVVYENLLGHVSDIGDTDARTKRLGRLLFEQTPLVSTLKTAAVQLDDEERLAVEANFASQLLAAIPENPNDENLVLSMSQSTYAWASDAAEDVQRLCASVMQELTDDSLPGGAFAVVNSPAVLTDFGHASNRTGFSPRSCRAMMMFLSSHEFQAEKDQLLADVLKALSQLPEQTERLLRKVYGEKRYVSFVRSEDIPAMLLGVLARKQPRDLFDSLPKRIASAAKEPYIEGQFDDFIRFVDSAVKTFLPWALRALERLSPFGSVAAMNVPWGELAKELEGLMAPDALGDF